MPAMNSTQATLVSAAATLSAEHLQACPVSQSIVLFAGCKHVMEPSFVVSELVPAGQLARIRAC